MESMIVEIKTMKKNLRDFKSTLQHFADSVLLRLHQQNEVPE